MKAKQIELTEEQYEQMITDIYGTFKIGCCEFDAGRILKELDPIAFNVGMSDEPEKWECGECNKEYETEEDAEECCKE